MDYDESSNLFEVPYFKDKPPHLYISRPRRPRSLVRRLRNPALVFLSLLATIYLYRRITVPRHAHANFLAAEAAYWSQYAYITYATTPAYLCNALMLLESLHRLGARPDKLLLYNNAWTLTPNTEIGRQLVKAMDVYGAILKPIKVVSTGRDGTWAESLTKLRAFEQTQYKRVLSLDSDATLRQHMDELFTLPSARIAATATYWLEDRRVASQLLLVEPSKDEYLRIMRQESRPGEQFDMEVINALYGDEFLEIPWRPYSVLTGEWRRASHNHFYAGEQETWDPMAVLEQAKYVHFSDWPVVAKPWMQNSVGQVEKVLKNCTQEESHDCDGLAVWAGIYRNYWERRGMVCKV